MIAKREPWTTTHILLLVLIIVLIIGLPLAGLTLLGSSACDMPVFQTINSGLNP